MKYLTIWFVFLFTFGCRENEQVEKADWFPPELLSTEITDEGWIIRTFAADSSMYHASSSDYIQNDQIMMTVLKKFETLLRYYPPRPDEKISDWVLGWRSHVRIVYDNRFISGGNHPFLGITKTISADFREFYIELTSIPIYQGGLTHTEVWEEAKKKK